jgi:uncharacterized membrane protein
MDPKVSTFLLAMLPVSELRGSIPLSLTFFGMKGYEAILYSVLGNIVIIPFVYLSLEFLTSSFIQKINFFRKFSMFFLEKIKSKYKKISFQNLFALTLFVAIPLPFTGAWSATIIAFLLKIPLFFAFLSISAGVVFSAILVFLLTKGGIFVVENLGWQIFLSIISFLILFFFLFKKNEEKGHSF